MADTEGRRPAEAFSVGEYIADEMKARGWTSYAAYRRYRQAKDLAR